jgi:hypothetical protein
MVCHREKQNCKIVTKQKMFIHKTMIRSNANLSIVYGSTVLLLDLGHFFSFLILYIVGSTPWTGDQSVARTLPTHRTTQTQNKRT